MHARDSKIVNRELKEQTTPTSQLSYLSIVHTWIIFSSQEDFRVLGKPTAISLLSYPQKRVQQRVTTKSVAEPEGFPRFPLKPPLNWLVSAASSATDHVNEYTWIYV